MSLFSIGMRGSELVDQHSTLMGICTGSIISKCIFEKAIKPTKLNKILRDSAVSYFSSLTESQWEPAAKKISQKILEVSINDEKLHYVSGKLKDQFLSSPAEHFINLSKIAAFAAKKMAKKAMKTNSPSENPMDTETRKAVLEKVICGKLTEAIQEVVLHSLTPICEKAVEKALIAATKAVAEKTYDFSVNKACSIVILPLIYGVARTTLETVGNHFQLPLTACLNYLPNTYTILGVSILSNTAQMVGVLWNEFRKPSDKIDMDKEEVRNLAFKFAKKSMSKGISSNKMLSYIGANKTEEDVDKLVNLLVNETIDFYWKDFHETKILGVPLVS